MTQYVAVKFKPWEHRTYTYSNDGPPVNVGDRVKVQTKDGPKEVEVDSVSEVKPAFECKPIIVEGAPVARPPRRRPPPREQPDLFPPPSAPINYQDGDDVPW